MSSWTWPLSESGGPRSRFFLDNLCRKVGCLSCSAHSKSKSFWMLSGPECSLVHCARFQLFLSSSGAHERYCLKNGLQDGWKNQGLRVCFLFAWHPQFHVHKNLESLVDKLLGQWFVWSEPDYLKWLKLCEYFMNRRWSFRFLHFSETDSTYQL